MILPKISGYIKTFIVKDKNNKLMSIGINDENLLVKYKVTWTMIEFYQSMMIDIQKPK